MRRIADWVYGFYWGEGIADDVPALAYYLVLSLAPFALGVAALALRLDDALNAVAVAAQLNRFLPEEIHGDVQRLVLGTRDNSPQLLAVAVVAMLWTTSGAIGVIERCLSRMLGAERHHIVTGRLRNMALGGMVATAVVLATLGTPIVGNAWNALPLRGSLPNAIVAALTTAGSILVFAAIYRYAPLTRLRWRSALLGAVPAGVGLQLVPNVVGLYVRTAAGLQAVRLFLVLAVVLLGLSIVAALVLIGAGIAARAERRARAGRRGPGAPSEGSVAAEVPERSARHARVATPS